MPVSREDLWAMYTDKNPRWLTEGANLTPAGVKKLFDQTYALGFVAGESVGKFQGKFEEIFSRFRKS